MRSAHSRSCWSARHVNFPSTSRARRSGPTPERALREGRLRGPAAIDWFVFPSGLFDPLPPFLVGRAGFDNWMIWKARQLGPVIDATDAVVAIHQPHDYTHLEGGKDEAYYGEEAKYNVALEAAGADLHAPRREPQDARRPFDPSQPWIGAASTRDREEDRLEAGRPMKVVGVFPEPTSYRSPLFDLIDERPEIDLVVVYSSRSLAGRTWRVANRTPRVPRWLSASWRRQSPATRLSHHPGGDPLP